MPKAIKVTEKNIPDILVYAHKREFNLDNLSYSLEDTASYGQDLYLITDGTMENHNVTFTEMWSADFFRNWKFTNEQFEFDFAEIEKA